MVKQGISAVFSGHMVLAEESSLSDELYLKSSFGEKKRKGKVQYSLVEALYLLEKDKLVVVDGRGKKLKFEDFIKKAQKIEPNFWVRYM